MPNSSMTTKSNSNLSSKTIRKSQYATSPLQADVVIYPLSGAFNASGRFNRSLLLDVLPVGEDNRKKLRAIANIKSPKLQLESFNKVQKAISTVMVSHKNLFRRASNYVSAANLLTRKGPLAYIDFMAARFVKNPLQHSFSGRVSTIGIDAGMQRVSLFNLIKMDSALNGSIDPEHDRMLSELKELGIDSISLSAEAVLEKGFMARAYSTLTALESILRNRLISQLSSSSDVDQELVIAQVDMMLNSIGMEVGYFLEGLGDMVSSDGIVRKVGNYSFRGEADFNIAKSRSGDGVKSAQPVSNYFILQQNGGNDFDRAYGYFADQFVGSDGLSFVSFILDVYTSHLLYSNCFVLGASEELADSEVDHEISASSLGFGEIVVDKTKGVIMIAAGNDFITLKANELSSLKRSSSSRSVIIDLSRMLTTKATESEVTMEIISASIYAEFLQSLVISPKLDQDSHDYELMVPAIASLIHAHGFNVFSKIVNDQAGNGGVIANQSESSTANKLMLAIFGIGYSDKPGNISASYIALLEFLDNMTSARKRLKDHFDKPVGSKSPETAISNILKGYDDMLARLKHVDDPALGLAEVKAFEESTDWVGSSSSLMYSNSLAPDHLRLEKYSFADDLLIDAEIVDAFNTSVARGIANVSFDPNPLIQTADGRNHQLICEYQSNLKATITEAGQVEIDGMNPLSFARLMANRTMMSIEVPASQITSHYQAAIGKFLLDPKAMKAITSSKTTSFSVDYSFSKNIRDLVLSKLAAFETAMSFDVAAFRYSVETFVAKYFYSILDFIAVTEMAVKHIDLGLISESNLDAVKSMLTDVKQQIITDGFGSLLIHSYDHNLTDQYGKGIPAFDLNDKVDEYEKFELLNEFFLNKVNRRTFGDQITTMINVVKTLNKGTSSLLDFRSIYELSPSLSNSGVDVLKNDETFQLDKLDIDVLKGVVQSKAITDAIKPMLKRDMTGVTANMAFDLVHLVKHATGSDSSRFDYKPNHNFFSGMDASFQVPSLLLAYVDLALKDRLKERYIYDGSNSDRANYAVLTQGQVTQSLSKLGFGLNDNKSLGIVNDIVTLTSSTAEDLFDQLCDKLDINPDAKLFAYELLPIANYIRGLGATVGFPLTLNQEYISQINRHLDKDGVSSIVDSMVLTGSDFRPVLTGYSFRDLVSLKDSIHDRFAGLVNPIVSIDIYTRPEELLKLMNSEFIEFVSNYDVKMIPLAQTDSLRMTYLPQVELMISEVKADLDITRLVGDNLCYSIFMNFLNTIVQMVSAPIESKDFVPASSDDDKDLDSDEHQEEEI